MSIAFLSISLRDTGADPGFDRGGGGGQIVTGLKLPFWGLNFVEFWCWGLIFGDRGGGPGPPPGSAPGDNQSASVSHVLFKVKFYYIL